jgi:hypothetical protein
MAMPGLRAGEGAPAHGRRTGRALVARGSGAGSGAGCGARSAERRRRRAAASCSGPTGESYGSGDERGAPSLRGRLRGERVGGRVGERIGERIGERLAGGAHVGERLGERLAERLGVYRGERLGRSQRRCFCGDCSVGNLSDSALEFRVNGAVALRLSSLNAGDALRDGASSSFPVAGDAQFGLISSGDDGAAGHCFHAATSVVTVACSRRRCRCRRRSDGEPRNGGGGASSRRSRGTRRPYLASSPRMSSASRCPRLSISAGI